MKEGFIIASQATVREALQLIDANHHGIVLVQDSAQRVIGTATDGDIRRKLLEGLNLEERIEHCVLFMS